MKLENLFQKQRNSRNVLQFTSHFRTFTREANNENNNNNMNFNNKKKKKKGIKIPNCYNAFREIISVQKQ